jgi:hypothetical protein
MKINEVTTTLKTYLATVRVVLRDSSTTARTTITADSSSQALMMLSKMYGAGNVLSLNQIVHESSETDQIQLEQAITPTVIQTQQPQLKNASVQSSQVSQRPRKRTVSSRPIPDQIKHKLIQDRLTKKLMRQSNIVKPTSDDIEIARDRVETELKRADLQYVKNRQAKFNKLERRR